MAEILKTPLAETDLLHIWLHIAQDNPSAATRFLGTIEQKFELIAKFPEIGRERRELAAGLRSFPVGNYVIFYRLVNHAIQIIRVLNGSRDLNAIF